MKFGVTASCGSAAQSIEMAVAAEQSGWDGFFAWDGISVGPMDTFDPWTILGAAAVQTTRLTLGDDYRVFVMYHWQDPRFSGPRQTRRGSDVCRQPVPRTTSR